MPVRRLYAVRTIGPADLSSGCVEPHYRKVLTRLLAAHAMAEKLTAFGYERALGIVSDPGLRPTIEKNTAGERKHARLIYRVLADLGVSEQVADRMMITVVRSPSFEAPCHFATHPADELGLLMAGLALDMTGLLMIGVNYRESSYAPHSRAAELILEDEAEHEAFASELLGTAVERFGNAPVAVALREWLPRAVNFFGPPGTGFTYDCLRYGLKARDNQELAELYLTVLERRAAQVGLELPLLTPDYPHQAA